MTSTHTVESSTVRTADLMTLPVGTDLTWRGLTCRHGATQSPLDGEPWPDCTVYTDPAAGIRLLEFGPVGLVHNDRRVLGPATMTIANILDVVGSGPDSDPVCRFATSIEPDRTGEEDVPWLSIWTGPVWDATDIDAASPASLPGDGRLSYRGVLSHRLNGINDLHTDPRERLQLQQYTNGEWVLRTGAHHTPVLLEHRRGLRTLDDVLAWAETALPILLGGSPNGRIGGFVVSAIGAGAPMTVWVW